MIFFLKLIFDNVVSGNLSSRSASIIKIMNICMTLKQGPNWGYWAQNWVIIGLLAQNAVKVVKFIKIVCFQWS
jgi:hypothetical protein